MCALAVLSGLGIFMSQGRTGSDITSAIFIVAVSGLLLFILHSVTQLALRSFGSSYVQRDEDDHPPHSSSDH
ncbi:MAG: hypothetical protein JJ974_06225 [Phycisphaerales bacterium]|nr:hypothetical protein [Phycisphaerales bacterium]